MESKVYYETNLLTHDWNQGTPIAEQTLRHLDSAIHMNSLFVLMTSSAKWLNKRLECVNFRFTVNSLGSEWFYCWLHYLFLCIAQFLFPSHLLFIHIPRLGVNSAWPGALFWWFRLVSGKQFESGSNHFRPCSWPHSCLAELIRSIGIYRCGLRLILRHECNVANRPRNLLWTVDLAGGRFNTTHGTRTEQPEWTCGCNNTIYHHSFTAVSILACVSHGSPNGCFPGCTVPC